MTAVSPYLPGKDLPHPAGHAPDEGGLLPGPYALRDRIVELQAGGGRPAQLVLIDVWPAERVGPDAQTALTAQVAACLRGLDWLAGDGPTRYGVLVTGGETDAEAVAARVVRVVADTVPGLLAVAGITGVHPGPTATEVHTRAVRALDRAHDAGPGAIVHHR